STGFPPTIRELRDEIGVSSLRGVTVHLDALERKGFIERNSKARGLRVLRNGEMGRRAQYIRIPLVGTVAAGTPILAQENIEKYVRVKRDQLKGSEKSFLLRVQGDSMIDAGIRPGDLAIISESATADSGDVVVALFDDEVTLKKFHKVDNYVALLPANAKYQPIIGKDFEIQGKLVGLLDEAQLFDDENWVDGDLLPVRREQSKHFPWIFGREVKE
ncbi:transcriptional repressor LexA, partial [candidate division WWE3 bacterium]|nr:transcriptional repressor LexA [candidate division WWE3 bacterium]